MEQANSLEAKRTAAAGQAKLAPVVKMALLEESPVAMLEGEGATEDMSGAEKVDTKDGTSTFGLPCEDATGPPINTGTV